jgi:hypothetical protein
MCDTLLDKRNNYYYLKNLTQKGLKMKVNYFQIFLINLFKNYLKLFWTYKNQFFVIVILYFILLNSIIFILDENIIPKLMIFLSDKLIIYQYEWLFGILDTLFFCCIKKSLEYYRRAAFAERYCLEKLLEYSDDFIGEFDRIHGNRNNNKILISGKNLSEIFLDKERESDHDCNDRYWLDFDRGDKFQNFMNNLIEYESGKEGLSISLSEKIEQTQNLENKFINLGKFCHKNSSTKYFEIYYRKYLFNNNNEIIDDILFYDVTNSVVAERKIEEFDLIKQKVYDKISHEFKTPINSILGLIENIKESVINKDESSTLKYLDLINNLSKYMIYLTNDVISLTNNLKIKKKIVNFKEILEFGLDILECLLRCNSNKFNFIKPVMNYDQEIDELKIFFR